MRLRIPRARLGTEALRFGSSRGEGGRRGSGRRHSDLEALEEKAEGEAQDPEGEARDGGHSDLEALEEKAEGEAQDGGTQT